MKKVIILLVGILFVNSCSDDNCSDVPSEKITEIKLCGLFDFQNDKNNLELDSKAAIETAVEVFTEQKNNNGINCTVNAQYLDYENNPNKAYDFYKSYEADGFSIFIGTMKGETVKKIKTASDNKNTLIISNNSTTKDLSIDDNFFRYCPNEKIESDVLSDLFIRKGIKAIVPLYLNDTENSGYSTSIANTFKTMGGKVYEATPYSATISDYSQIIEKFRIVLLQALKEFSTAEVAVFHSGSQEAATIYNVLSKDNVFSTVMWFGNKNISKYDFTKSNIDVQNFAKKIKLFSPLITHDSFLSDNATAIIDKIKIKTGKSEVNPYAVAIYDATMNALQANYLTLNVQKDNLKSQFIKISNQTQGISGITILDENGDRINSDYNFWIYGKDDMNIWAIDSYYNMLYDKWQTK